MRATTFPLGYNGKISKQRKGRKLDVQPGDAAKAGCPVKYQPSQLCRVARWVGALSVTLPVRLLVSILVQSSESPGHCRRSRRLDAHWRFAFPARDKSVRRAM